MESDKEWRYWGETDPLYAVYSRSDKKKGLPGAWSDDDFRRSGEAYFADVARQWRQYGMGRLRCIEVGCGAGRITGQLLHHFEAVTALDVSERQIETAARLLGPLASRVSFHVVDRPVIPAPDGGCDGFFSCEVFQHFSDPTVVGRYLLAAYPKLSAGGTICFQLPVKGMQRLASPLFRLRARSTGIQRALGRRLIMEYRYYSAPDVFADMKTAGFTDCEMRIFETHEHDGRHVYFFGRKGRGS